MSGFKQFGDVIRFPRQDPVKTVFEEGVPRLLRQVSEVLAAQGIPLEAALPTLQVYYVPAVEGPGGTHCDPLMQRPRPDVPTILPDQLLAWKFSVWAEEPAGTEALVEGVSLARSR